MHIALFGGRFDPPHIGHVAIAQEIIKIMPELDEVWLLPDSTHPWKPTIASAQDRLEMLRLIEEPRIKAHDDAIKLGGINYTIKTVKYLYASTTNTYVWICGSDQIRDFSRWKDYKELEQLISFIVFPRKGYESFDYLPKNFSMLYPKDYKVTDYSSTEVRKRLKEGKAISDIVPESIVSYIAQKNLYK